MGWRGRRVILANKRWPLIGGIFRKMYMFSESVRIICFEYTMLAANSFIFMLHYAA